MSDSTATVALGAAGEAQALRFYDSGGHHPENGTLLGFWLYLMSDCLVFASLFATYGVLGRNYAGGPSGADLCALPRVLQPHDQAPIPPARAARARVLPVRVARG